MNYSLAGIRQTERRREAPAEERDVAAGVRGQQVPGVHGYRFAAVDRGGYGDPVCVQIINSAGHEVAWARGHTKPDLLRDAADKVRTHEATRSES